MHGPVGNPNYINLESFQMCTIDLKTKSCYGIKILRERANSFFYCKYKASILLFYGFKTMIKSCISLQTPVDLCNFLITHKKSPRTRQWYQCYNSWTEYPRYQNHCGLFNKPTSRTKGLPYVTCLKIGRQLNVDIDVVV